MKNKILVCLMLLGTLCCTFSTTVVLASEDTNAIEPRMNIEKVINKYETVYNRSPFIKLYDENFSYITLQYPHSYTYTISEKGCTTLGDMLAGNVRYRYTYKYVTK